MSVRLLKRLTIPFVLASAIVLSCGDDNVDANSRDASADSQSTDAGVVDSFVPTVFTEAAAPSFNIWPASLGPLVYWSGPVMLGSPNVYYIWYGDWKGSNTPAILEDLIKGFSETGYSNALAKFYQVSREGFDSGVEAGTQEFLSGHVSFARSIYPEYSRGQYLHMGDVVGVITDLLHSNSLPYDPNGIYFVLASSDVTEQADEYDSFCESYCGYHNSTNIDGITIKYSFVGDPGSCTTNCIPQSALFFDAGLAKSPNDNWSADAMASVIIHELSEAMTDPEPYGNPAWLDINMSYENGDMCAWRFDPTYPTVNGSRANVRWGQRDFLVQQTWILDSDGGRCDLQP